MPLSNPYGPAIRKFKKTATIAAASQFLGTEFSARARKNCILKPAAVYLKMGSEAKTWKLVYAFNYGGTIGTVNHVIKQSVDPAGNPATTTATDVLITFEIAELEKIWLIDGGQIQLITTSATAAMQATIHYEEYDNSVTTRAYDPVRYS